jgi:hypothetical protein
MAAGMHYLSVLKAFKLSVSLIFEIEKNYSTSLTNGLLSPFFFNSAHDPSNSSCLL